MQIIVVGKELAPPTQKCHAPLAAVESPCFLVILHSTNQNSKDSTHENPIDAGKHDTAVMFSRVICHWHITHS